MVVYQRDQPGGSAPDPDPDRVFHALADATRRDILARTLSGEHTVSALAEAYPMSFAAVQKHVAVLEGARLISKRRRGRERLVAANVETIRETARLLDQLEAIWLERIDRFGVALDEEEEDEGR
jgi:DNA-binding transcriptional ArsR family regulator